MIPVLAVDDPVAACRTLAAQFGFAQIGPGRMAFGSAQIAVVGSRVLPDALIPLQLDHVAFQVPDADAVYRNFSAAGAELDPNFTPGGPRDIPQFWDHGVRFVFFQGPQGAPFEFCAKTAVTGPVDRGHSHFAIRSVDLDQAEAALGAFGPTCIAKHSLPGTPQPVSVRFLQAGSVVFELFDEAPVVTHADLSGWVGLLPDGA